MLKYAAREFCLNTGLHGYNFLFLPKRALLERIIWIIIVSASLIVAVVVSWLAWTNTQKHHVQVVIDSTHHPIWNYPFPAVTICNFNQISKSKLHEAIRNMKHHEEWSTEFFHRYSRYLVHLLPDSLDRVPQRNLTRFQDLLDRNNIAAEELFQRVTPNCTEMLQRCKWKGEEKRCEVIFEQIKSSFGFCCSFNYFSLRHHTFSGALSTRSPVKPRRVTGCGFKTGLEVLIDNKPEDYYATSISSYGHWIFIHHPYEFLDWSVNCMLLGLKTIKLINVSPILAECSTNVANLDVKDRDCLFFSERKMNSFRYYTYHNCLTECRAKIMIRLCGCIPFYYYNENGTFRDNRICNLRDSSCLSRHIRAFMSSVPGVGNEIEVKEKLDPCSCLPNCEYCYYPVDASTGEFLRNYSSNGYTLFGTVKIRHQSVLRVFFNDLVATKNTKVLRYYWHTLFALFGGLLGLFTGFNFGCAFEVVYFFVVRIIVKKFYTK